MGLLSGIVKGPGKFNLEKKPKGRYENHLQVFQGQSCGRGTWLILCCSAGKNQCCKKKLLSFGAFVSTPV